MTTPDQMKKRHRDPAISRNVRKKLTDEQVRQIHELYAEGHTQSALAAKFGVSQPVISGIVIGRNWKTIFNEFHGNQGE